MRRGSIPRRYAKALLELGIENKKVKEYGEQLQQFADVLTTTPQLFNVLRNPAYPPEKRKAVLTNVLDTMALDTIVKNFILLVHDRRRIEHLPDMATTYMDLSDKMEGKVRATVVSAIDLTAEQQKKISDTLAKKTGKDVLLTLQKDPSIIGGVIAIVSNLRFDYSLKGQLKKIERELVG